MTDTILELIKLGVVGPLLAIAVGYIWKLHKDLQTSHKEKSEVATATTERLLLTNEKWQGAIANSTRILESSKDAIERLEGTVRELERTTVRLQAMVEKKD